MHRQVSHSQFLISVLGDLSVMRVGLFLNDFKGRELFDHGKQLKDLKQGSDGLLIRYKDLGPVVSQQLTLNFAYIGPCVMTVVFYFFSKQIYGVD